LRGGAGRDFAGPAGQERDADAAFVEIAFDAAEFAAAVEEAGVVIAFAMRAVVTGEDDQRIGIEAGIVNGLEHRARIAVQARHQGGETAFHFGPGFVLVRLVIGNVDAVGLGGTAFVIGMRAGIGEIEEEELGRRALNEIDGFFGVVVLHERAAAAEPVLCEKDFGSVFPLSVGE